MLDGNNAKTFLNASGKLSMVSSAVPGDLLVPIEAHRILDVCTILNSVISNTMGCVLTEGYEDNIAAYGAALPELLAYAGEELGLEGRLEVTWKEHILVCHFGQWLAEKDDNNNQDQFNSGLDIPMNENLYSEADELNTIGEQFNTEEKKSKKKSAESEAKKKKGGADWAEQTGESVHHDWDARVWQNYKLNDDNPR